MAAKRKREIKKGDASSAEAVGRYDDLLWGINAVQEALQHNIRSIGEVLIQQGKSGSRIQQIIDLARSNQVKVRFVETARLPVPRNCVHQGVVARQAATEFLSFDELLESLAAEQVGSGPKLLVLDSVQDPRNLGSILRSALAAGFSHVILTRERSAPVTGTVARTSAGAIARLQLCQVVNLAQTLQRLKEKGFWVYGAVADSAATSVYQTDFSGSLCLVIGSEGKGIRPLVQRECDHLVTIPMESTFDSLNVAVAAAIIMFEINRQG